MPSSEKVMTPSAMCSTTERIFSSLPTSALLVSSSSRVRSATLASRFSFIERSASCARRRSLTSRR